MLADMEALLEQQEGFRANPYRDSRGFLTIGFGTNLDAGITREQAEALMDCQLAANEAALQAYPWFAGLDEVRRGVIENMAYNIGVSGVLEFKDMLAAIEAKDWPEAAHQMRASVWRVQVGDRALVLADIMETGVMPDAAV
jgi:lysozyme